MEHLTRKLLSTFFNQAANAYSEHGMPALEPGDLVIVDNCPIHRLNREVRVSNFLHRMGIEYIFLPRYSPELNIAENCFLKIKTILKQEKFTNLIRANLKVAITTAVNEISVRDIKAFCKATGYLNVN